MKENALASIIISSYNYEQFLKQTIDSALKQTYPFVEVIVVDDGSSDKSPEIIRSYGDAIIPILKQNNGQASAFNAGFKASRGSAICFVDSDDLLMSDAIERAMKLVEDDSVVKVHWPMVLIDQDGKPTGKVMHRKDLSEGDLQDTLIKLGPAGYNWPSTSGNLWKRTYIQTIFPIPEVEYRIGPDVYLSALAPLFGQIKKLSDPHGCYRIHQENNTIRRSLEKRAVEAELRWTHSFEVLSNYCAIRGIPTNIDLWKEKSWWHQTALAIKEIECLISEGDKFILIDEDQWVTGGAISNRYCSPLMKRDGRYWRPLTEDEEVIQDEVDRQQKLGFNFIVFTSPAFWWFEYYKIFKEYLERNYVCILENTRLVVYDIRKKKAQSVRHKASHPVNQNNL